MGSLSSVTLDQATTRLFLKGSVMFSYEERPENADIRPRAGVAARRSDSDSRRPENLPPVDIDPIRLRVLEGQFHQGIESLDASIDEALAALIAAFNRLRGCGGDGRVCPQCGRIARLSHRSRGNAKLCSPSCASLYDAENKPPQPRRRRLASGAVI